MKLSEGDSDQCISTVASSLICVTMEDSGGWLSSGGPGGGNPAFASRLPLC